MLINSNQSLTTAILQTLAYSDIFDYPLTTSEVHHYLTGVAVSFESVKEVLERNGTLVRTGIYFTLPGRAGIVPTRIQREQHSRGLMPLAIRYGRILGSLPFIRMVALTGSLAVMNVSRNDDFDYMLVTVPGRVWTARAFALLFNRIVKPFGHTICPNLIIAESALEWPLHDLYSARELYQMIPITGMNVYQELMLANQWARAVFPNAPIAAGSAPTNNRAQCSALQGLLELLWRGKFGNRFERWEMDRKIARFSKQNGFGDETVFNAEVCQGNFHHHRKWTQSVFEERLNELGVGSPGEKGEGLEVGR